MAAAGGQARQVTPSLGDLARAHPVGLAKLDTAGRYEHKPHLKVLTRNLLKVFTGKIRGLIVVMPPRHGKSWMTSRYFPSWWLGKRPDNEIILSSYNDDKASDWGEECRNVLERWGKPVFDMGIRQGSQAKHHWKTTQGGQMLTSGVGGSATGHGADVYLIDDPVKNAKDAQSQAVQRDQQNWFRSVVLTRRYEHSAVILTLTRWDENDLAGWILREAEEKEHGIDWHVVHLPAIATEELPDALDRSPGEALCPDWFSEQYLQEVEEELGPYWFSALFQGSPQPPDGRIINRSWFRTWTVETAKTMVDGELKAQQVAVLHRPDQEPKRYPFQELEVLHTKDAAETTGDTSAYTVVATWLVTPENDLLLWDLTREKEELAELRQIARDHLKWGGVLHIEKKSHGTALIQDLQKEGLAVKAFQPEGNKIIRARVAQARYSAGRIYHPHPGKAPWLKDFERELLAFPNSDHADQMDVTSHAAILMAQRREQRIRLL